MTLLRREYPPQNRHSPRLRFSLKRCFGWTCESSALQSERTAAPLGPATSFAKSGQRFPRSVTKKESDSENDEGSAAMSSPSSLLFGP